MEPLEVFGAHALSAVVDRVLEVRPSRLVADLTHGVNYMVVSLARAVLEAARVFSASSGLSVGVEMFNSEPVEEGVGSARIHRVSRVGFEPRRAAEEIAFGLSRQRGEARHYKVVSSSPEVGRSLGDVCEWGFVREVQRLARSASTALLYNMPLAALYIAAEVEGLSGGRPLLSKVAGLLELCRAQTIKHTVIEPSGEGYVVVHRAALSLEGVTRTLYSAALLDYIAGAVADSLGWVPDLEELDVRGVRIVELEEVSGRLGSLYEAIARSELAQLRDRCELGVRGGCELAVGKERWPERACEESSLDERNLKAHAGLERNVVEGRLAEGELYLRYRRGCWDLVKRRLESI